MEGLAVIGMSLGMVVIGLVQELPHLICINKYFCYSFFLSFNPSILTVLFLARLGNF